MKISNQRLKSTPKTTFIDRTVENRFAPILSRSAIKPTYLGILTLSYPDSQVRRRATGGGPLIEPAATVRAVLSAKPVQNAAMRSMDVSLKP